jgi:hypothetical protein
MFGGMPVWHVSVARVAKDRRSIKPRALWSVAEIRHAARIAVTALMGVGVADKSYQWEENGEGAIHIRRRLSQPEIDLLHQQRPTCPVFTHGVARPSVT